MSGRPRKVGIHSAKGVPQERYPPVRPNCLADRAEKFFHRVVVQGPETPPAGWFLRKGEPTVLRARPDESTRRRRGRGPARRGSANEQPGERNERDEIQHLRNVQCALPHCRAGREQSAGVDRGEQQRRRHGHEPLRQGQRRLFPAAGQAAAGESHAARGRPRCRRLARGFLGRGL